MHDDSARRTPRPLDLGSLLSGPSQPSRRRRTPRGANIFPRLPEPPADAPEPRERWTARPHPVWCDRDECYSGPFMTVHSKPVSWTNPAGTRRFSAAMMRRDDYAPDGTLVGCGEARIHPGGPEQLDGPLHDPLARAMDPADSAAYREALAALEQEVERDREQVRAQGDA